MRTAVLRTGLAEAEKQTPPDRFRRILPHGEPQPYGCLRHVAHGIPRPICSSVGRVSDRLRWVILGPLALVVGYIGGSYAENLVVGRMNFRQVLGLIPPNSPHPLPTLAAVITGRCVGVFLLVATAYGISRRARRSRPGLPGSRPPPFSSS